MKILAKALFFMFKKQMTEIAFNNQRKPKDLSKTEFKFIDSNGVRYYSYMDDFDIPILRKGMIEKCLNELNMALDGKDMVLIIDSMEKAINEKDKHGKMSPNIGLIGHLINEIKSRQNNLLHPEIMFDMVSYLYIREDENPSEIDTEIHIQKIEQFKKDSKGGLYDFFYLAGLNGYIPFLKELKGDLETTLTVGKAKIQALHNQLTDYTSAR